MNNKGESTLALGIVSAIFIFIIGVMVISLFQDEITEVRDPSKLDCTNVSGISDGTKLTCLLFDITIPYFFLMIFSISGGVIITRFLK